MKTLIISILMLVSFCIQARDYSFTVISQDESGMLVKFELTDSRLKALGNSSWTSAVFNGGAYIMQQGCPDLMKAVRSFVIPSSGRATVSVISSYFFDQESILAAPSKGNLYRNQDPSKIPLQTGDVYSVDAFWPGMLCEAGDPYILRDLRGQALSVYPMQYNPVTQVLRTYTTIIIRIDFSQEKSVNEMNGEIAAGQNLSYEYARIYERHFMNYSNLRYTPVEEDGNLLIISHASFMQAMQPFVDWKKQKGIPAEIVDVATIGGVAQIKTYVQNYYNTNGLTYLLLVGDNAQVPASSTTAGPSDNDYGYVAGNDHYPDIFVGRFSAETVAHVQTQVERIIKYEKYPNVDDVWYKKGVGIASEEGPGDDNELDFEHVRNMRTKLLAFTYNNFGEYYEGDQGGLDAPGNPTSADVHSTLVTEGAGIIVYTGHGWDQGFGTSGYSNTNVAQLQNTNRLPFIWSVACVNGSFLNTTCFGEAWLRATYNNQPAGALATLMSTINQSWNPPMCGQDEMVDLLVESYAGNIKRSFGGLSMNGCMKMNDEYGAAGDEMTDTWALFGDPSVVVRTDKTQPLTVTHPASVYTGTTDVLVNCNTPGALVCLTINNEILGKGYIGGGQVLITFPALQVVDTILVTVTAFNKTPYFGEILIIPPTGPYVISQTVVVSDPTGNQNSLCDYSENIQLEVSLKNLGVLTATGVSAVLSSSSPWVTITDATEPYGNINAGASVTISNAFAFTVSSSVPDMTNAAFVLTASDGSDVWNSNINLMLHAPSLSIPSVSVSDNTGGNGNGRLDPGETADLIYACYNAGTSASLTGTASVTCSSPYITINNTTSPASVMNPSAGINASFSISVDPSTPSGHYATFVCTLVCGSYQTVKTVTIPVGIVLEDWESGGFTQFPWSTTNYGNVPWTTSGVAPIWEGSFSARSGVITHDETSELNITINVLTADSISFYRKVSCEQGMDYSGYYYWWDYLEFLVDGVSIVKWDGEQDWARFAYFITTGNHTLTWRFLKDYVVSAGQDAAWIDFIVFPAIDIISGIRPLQTSVVQVYPNPFSDVLYMPEDNGIYSITILNLTGNVLYHSESYTSSVATDHLPAGMYLLKINMRDETVMKRIVKQ
jgi:hypothetical protein